MVAKKSIINALKEAGFERQNSMSECMEAKNRAYFIQVTSRAKQGWKHTFHNPHTNELLEFEMYWMTRITPGAQRSIKLNKNNEPIINSIITDFINN